VAQGEDDPEVSLEDLVAQARAAWPSFRVTAEEFRAHLEAAGGARASRVADLYVAFAGSRGDPAALAVLEQVLGEAASMALSGMGAAAAKRDEICQLVRFKVLVAEPGATPKLAEFSGRGSLKSWLRTVVARTAIDVLRDEQRGQLADEDELQALPDPGLDPELAHIKQKYALEFTAALRHAVASLDPREQLLLRQYYVDGLTTAELASLHRLHVVTVVRLLGKARETVAERTRTALADQLKLQASEVQSIVRLVQSQINIGLSTILRGPPR
jgi:RNA polymerase sigma-70 factor (ECF subfamily)